MPKMKTSRGAAKRFKTTGTGKLRRFHSSKSHLLTGKATRRMRPLRKGTLVHPADLKRMLGFTSGRRDVPVIVEDGQVTIGFGGT